MTSSVDELTFKIGLSGTYWNKVPTYLISIVNADGSFAAGMHDCAAISKTSGEVEYIEFTAALPDDGEYVLHIALCDKDWTDTIHENGTILKDMLLNIESIEIDNIDLGTLRHTASKFVLDIAQEYNDQVISELKNCVNLGWNGHYTIAFTTPLHYWLLENL